jgi:hypothetical protein
VQQLVAMGFDADAAARAARGCDNVDAAVTKILEGGNADDPMTGGDESGGSDSNADKTSDSDSDTDSSSGSDDDPSLATPRRRAMKTMRIFRHSRTRSAHFSPRSRPRKSSMSRPSAPRCASSHSSTPGEKKKKSRKILILKIENWLHFSCLTLTRHARAFSRRPRPTRRARVPP